MIPHTLTISNFLSYRDTSVLDLRGVHLACISGLNGAGKSSLLDAMTWALFGKSRAGSDDDVVNRIAAANGHAAEITFVFELEGALYRIIRRKVAGKSKQLELHICGEDVDGHTQWRVLTESKVTETQKVIDNLLRMNYDVFTNASFLLQGKADEFTTKTPDKRKEVLADILDVRQWDTYREMATDQRKVTDIELTLLNRQLEDITAELMQEEERVRVLELAEAEEATVRAQQEAQDSLVMRLRQTQGLIDQQTAFLARTQTDLDAVQTELQRVERDAARRRAELEEHRALLDRREAIEAEYAELQAAVADEHAAIQRELHPMEMALNNARTRLESRRQELEAQGQTAATAAGERDSLAARLVAARERLEIVSARAAAAAEQEGAWHDTRARLQELEAGRRLWVQERDQLAALAAEAARQTEVRAQVEASLSAAQSRLDKASADLARLDEQRQQAADLRSERAALEGELVTLQKAGEETRGRINLLQSEASQECPLCDQPLTPSHRQGVLAKLEAEVLERRAGYRTLQTRIKALGEQIDGLKSDDSRQKLLERERDTQQSAVGRYEAQIQQADATLANWNDGQGQGRLAELQAALEGDGGEAQLRAEMASLQPAAERARELRREQQVLASEVARDEARHEHLAQVAQAWEDSGRPELATVTGQLEQQTYAQAERAALAAVEARLAAVGYDPAAHSAARARHAAAVPAQEAWEQLRRAEAAVKPLSDSLEDLEGQRARVVGQVAALRAQQEQLTQMLRELQAQAGDVRAAETELAHLREAQAEAIRATSVARQRVEVLGDQRRQGERLRERKTALNRRLGMLRQLEEACGRKGVQALLIDKALPEIEDYANELLVRLSGGEMSVRFDATRVGKTTGEQIETLDIKIGDSVGVRPYENYSGGEQFRVNFAIRLALSQVLARRAGARLRTLVIDEGFGSQDPEGRQRLVEAINAVQPEFECILIITHLDELRDKFPARIDVEKTATGSRLSVVAV